MSDNIVHLEGFAEPLKSHRIYCVGSPNLLPSLVRSRLALVDGEVAHRGRKALFIQEGFAHSAWLLRMKWDAVFVLKEALDLRLGLTYISNAQKPVRLVWAGAEPASSVFQHLSRVEGLTLISLGINVPNHPDWWDAVFWTHDTSLESIEPFLLYRLGAATMGKYNLNSVMKEIKASEVGLVWSSIRESDKSGSLYWFDPAEGGGGTALYTRQEATDILQSVADSIANM